MTVRGELALRSRSLLRPLRVPLYRRLWCSQLASELGDWAARLALSLAVYDRTRSAAWSAMVVTVSVLPWVGIGQVLVALAEHLPRRTAMIGADLFRFGVYGALIFYSPTWALFSGAFLAACATPVFEASRYAVKAEATADDALYGAALVLFRTTGQLAIMGGFALGGLLVATVGFHGALAVNAASFLLSASFLGGLTLRGRAVSRAGGPGGGARRRMVAGARVMLLDPVLRWCTVLAIAVSAPGMAVEAITSAYGHGDARVVTILSLAVPVGCALAAVVAPHAGEAKRLLRAAASLPLVGGLTGLLVFLAVPAAPYAAAGFLAAGLAVAVPIPAGPVMGRRLPDSVRSTSFAVIQGACLLGQSSGAAIGGLMASAFGAPVAAAAACAFLGCVGGLALVGLPNPSNPLAQRLIPAPAT